MKEAFLVLFLAVSFVGKSQKFIPPIIPDDLKDKEERAEYCLLHYWDNYDFEDPYVFLEGDIMLQYFSCLREVPYCISEASIRQTLGNASKSNQIFSLFIDTYRVYLFNTKSFFCDYDRYLAVDEFIINNNLISQSKKSEFELEKRIILTNRVGNKASDFTVVDKNDDLVGLYGIESEYLLVFFFNPNCSICMETTEKLSRSNVVGRMINDGKLKVFAVCPYNEYDAWKNAEYPEEWLVGYDKEHRIDGEHLYYFLESSCLYLLDKNKVVLMKDARLDFLENYLSGLLISK